MSTDQPREPGPAGRSRLAGPGAWAKAAAGVLFRTWLWGWAAITQLVLDLLLALPYLTLLGVLVVAVSLVPVFGVGLFLVAPILLIAMVLAAFERLRVLAFVGVRLPPAAPPDPRLPFWRRILLDVRPWKALAHLTLSALWGLLAGGATMFLVSLSFALAALPFYAAALPHGRLTMPVLGTPPAAAWLALVGIGGLLVLPLVARGLVGIDLALARWLLSPDEGERVAELTQRVERLTQTREMTVDSVELERRRIERDLHDGPQQRLVALAMDLGMARQKLDDDPDAARALLDQAHAAAKEAIVEMRQVARGIHPPVLTDRGLDAALSALAARSPVPVTVRVRLPGRPSATAEAIAYFCVSEALTNVAKHSGASSANVEVTQADGVLRVQVGDDGRGGADPALGTGLTGLRQRLAAVDGTLSIDSPPGGGTRLLITLPDPAPRPAPASGPEPRRRPAPTPPTSRSTE